MRPKGKKGLKTIFVIFFILILSGIAIANPFLDVPLNHWSYNALNDLSEKGYTSYSLIGMDQKPRTLTRFEFAQILVGIMENMGGKIDRSEVISNYDKTTLEKLVWEFQTELKNMKIEKELFIKVLGEKNALVQTLSEENTKITANEEPLSISGDYSIVYRIFFPPDPQAGKFTSEWEDELNMEIKFKLGESVTGKLNFSVPDILTNSRDY